MGLDVKHFELKANHFVHYLIEILILFMVTLPIEKVTMC